MAVYDFAAAPIERQRLFAWGLLVLLAASLVLHVAVYAANSTSGAFRVLAIGIVTLALVSMGVGAWGLLGTPRLDALRRGLNRWRTPYLVGAISVCMVYGINMRPEWVYAHTGLTLALLLTLVYAAGFDGAVRVSRLALVGIGAAIIGVTLLRVYALSYYPAHNITDEAWVLGWALSYVRTGQFSDLINYYGGADIQRFMLPVAWWVSLFGTGFWETRLFFFLASMLVIVLGALAARNLYRHAWITALVMFSSAVVMSGARLRHDIGLALAMAAAIWLWSAAIKRDQAWLHLLAGMMIGLGMFAHYHATFMGVALLIGLYVPRWIQSRRLVPGRGLILFALGGMIGAAIVIVVQIIPDWQGFLAVRRVRNPLGLLDYVNAFFAHIQNVIVHSQYEFLLIAAALIVALWRRRSLDVSLAIIVIIAHIGLAIFAAIPLMYYVVPLGAVYGLLIAGLFETQRPIEGVGTRFIASDDGRHRQAKVARRPYDSTDREKRLVGVAISARGVAAVCFLTVGLGFTLTDPFAHLRAGEPVALQPPAAIAWIRANTQPDDMIVGEHFYYLFLTDMHFVSPMSPEYMQPQFRPTFEAAALVLDESAAHGGRADITLEQYTFRSAVWDVIAPDLVVIDRNLSSCCMLPILDPIYLQSRGYTLVATIDGEMTPVLIYRKAN